MAPGTIPPATPETAPPPQEAAEIEQLRAKVEEHLNASKRWQAEYVNYQARVARDREADRKYSNETFMRELLPAIDIAQKAVAQLQKAGVPASAVEAVRLAEKELLRILGRHGVTPIETAGAKFDPELHEAVTAVDTPDHEDGAILEELGRGYRIHDRILRPASVKVARRVPKA